MRKLGRSILFFFFALLFIAVAPTAILYSQGWRFDFEANDFIKTGGLFIRTNSPARISINGEFKKRTSAWTNSAFFKNLLPKAYKIEVTREGYHSWKKDLQIKEEEVTEAKYIILFPKNLDLNLIEEKADNYFSLPNQNEFITEEQKDNHFSLYLHDVDQENKRKFYSGSSTLSNLKVGPNNQKVLIKTEENGKNSYTIIDLTDEMGSTTLSSLPPQTKEVHFNPRDPSELFIFRESPQALLLRTDYSSQNPTFQKVISNFLDYEILNDKIIWLSQEGFLFESNFSGDIDDTITLKPLKIEKGINLEIKADSSNIFLKRGANLLWFNSEEREFQEIFTSINSSKSMDDVVRFSPGHQKLLVNTGHELWILFLSKKYDQPQKEKGDKVFLTRISKEIKDSLWLNSNYLSFRVNGKIKATEIDNRSQINIVDLLNSDQIEKVYWNGNNHRFYLLKEKQLYNSGVLFP